MGAQHFIAAQVWHIVSFQPELNPQKSRPTNDTFLPSLVLWLILTRSAPCRLGWSARLRGTRCVQCPRILGLVADSLLPSHATWNYYSRWTPYSVPTYQKRAGSKFRAKRPEVYVTFG